jgi:hypothetical protein
LSEMAWPDLVGMFMTQSVKEVRPTI